MKKSLHTFILLLSITMFAIPVELDADVSITRGVSYNNLTVSKTIGELLIATPGSSSNHNKKRIVLKKHIVDGVNTLTQSMFQDAQGNNLENVIFVIKHHYYLPEDIILPANCELKFKKRGEISGHGFKGSVLNETLYAKWFKDESSLLYTINNLTGYSTIEFESGKTYLFDGVLSPGTSVTINGNYATIGRVDVNNNTSKPIINIRPDTKLDHIIIKNINFDGGVVAGLPVRVDYHQNMIVVNNVSKVVMKNIILEHFRPPYVSGLSPSNDFINISQYNEVLFDHVVFKNNFIYGEVVDFYPAGGNATSTTNISNDIVEITNSIFDFRGGRCYSVINCMGGRLNFSHNEIYGCIGALNAFVHDSHISYNIYADAENGFVDLSEQGQYFSKNVVIANNTIMNISKFIHPKYGKNTTHLLECYGAENVTVVNNFYEPASTGNEIDKAGNVFALSDGTKNVIIKDNHILCNGLLYGSIGGEPNENIQFVNNQFYQGDLKIYDLIRLHGERGIAFVDNKFCISSSEKEKITGALILIDKEGQLLSGLKFLNNELRYNVYTPLFVYTGKGDYPAIINLELRDNKALGREKMTASIQNKGGNLAKTSNNSMLSVYENHYKNITLDEEESVIDHPIIMKDNALFDSGESPRIEFVGEGRIDGRMNINRNKTIVKGALNGIKQ